MSGATTIGGVLVLGSLGSLALLGYRALYPAALPGPEPLALPLPVATAPVAAPMDPQAAALQAQLQGQQLQAQLLAQQGQQAAALRQQTLAAQTQLALARLQSQQVAQQSAAQAAISAANNQAATTQAIVKSVTGGVQSIGGVLQKVLGGDSATTLPNSFQTASLDNSGFSANSLTAAQQTALIEPTDLGSTSGSIPASTFNPSPPNLDLNFNQTTSLFNTDVGFGGNSFTGGGDFIV